MSYETLRQTGKPTVTGKSYSSRQALSNRKTRGPICNKSFLNIIYPWIYIYWVVVKIMVLFWVPIIIRHLWFRVPKKGPQFWQPPIYTYIYFYFWFVYTYIYIYKNIHICVDTDTYAHICIWLYMYTHTSLHRCIYVYICVEAQTVIGGI